MVHSIFSLEEETFLLVFQPVGFCVPLSLFLIFPIFNLEQMELNFKLVQNNQVTTIASDMMTSNRSTLSPDEQ